MGPHIQKVLIKLSGDGTRSSAASSFIFLTFSFPNLATDVLAASSIYYNYTQTKKAVKNV